MLFSLAVEGALSILPKEITAAIRLLAPVNNTSSVSAYLGSRKLCHELYTPRRTLLAEIITQLNFPKL